MTTLDRTIRALMQKVTEKVILPRFQNLAAGEIIEKATDDLVTVADREAEAMLSEELAKIDPNLAIVGEEAAHADPTIKDALANDCWIIDPIDGTYNFAHGKPPFGIILARSERGICQSGWIFDCLSGRFCAAHRKKGAWLGDERLEARETAAEKPVAAISMIFLSEEQQDTVQRTIAPHYRLVDIPRCAAEQYPRLALGENDVSSFERTLPWDHAAGVLWLNEAGGRAARLDGTEYRVDEGDKSGLIGASSPRMWEAFANRVVASGT